MAIKSTILIVGIGLTLLSLCSCLPNGFETKRNEKRQFEPTDNGTCFELAAEGSENITLYCFLDLVDSLDNYTSSTVSVCSSACNSAYTAYLNCYGAANTQLFYSLLCPNGYQGPTPAPTTKAAASHVTYDFAVVLVSAAVLKITG